jgi:hypothetical protein
LKSKKLNLLSGSKSNGFFFLPSGSSSTFTSSFFSSFFFGYSGFCFFLGDSFFFLFSFSAGTALIVIYGAAHAFLQC